MRKITIILVLLINITYYSCSKDSSSDIINKQTDIYALYTEYGDPSGNGIINLWKNDKTTQITNGNKNAYASSIFVNNSDIYIAGEEEQSLGMGVTQGAKLWKNFIEIPLPDVEAGVTFFNDVVYSNNILYVLGFDRSPIGNHHKIKLWKNGIVSHISNETINSRPYNMYINNEDVYVLGTMQIDGSSKPILTLWKNGVATRLTDGSNSVFPRDIHVSKNNTFILAIENEGTTQVGKLWVNGEVLSTFNTDFKPKKIFVNNNDVYVIGETTGGIREAQLYKNEELFATLGASGTASYVNDIFIKNNKVYVAFSQQIIDSRKYVSKLWIDGEVKDLTNISESSWVEGIFVE